MDDTCYFNTYLKEHQIKSGAGEESFFSANLRHNVIIMLDNLERLKFRSDTGPGESRSKLICTLPLTIWGVSKSQPEFRVWHDPACHTFTSCDCKRYKTMIKKGHINITTPMLTESTQLTRFWELCHWGYLTDWKWIGKSEFTILILQANCFQLNYRPYVIKMNM